jgi:hypothetical protein
MSASGGASTAASRCARASSSCAAAVGAALGCEPLDGAPLGGDVRGEHATISERGASRRTPLS